MPEFTLYGNVASTATNRVRLMLADANFTDYNFVNLNFQNAEHKSAEHLARNPYGRVPVLTLLPDGPTLYESRAICKFLAARYSLPYMPLSADPLARAQFDQAESIETTLFAPVADKVSYEKFAKAAMGMAADEQTVAQARVRLEAAFGVLEGELGSQGWMTGGEKFGMVDVWFLVMVHRLKACGEGELVRRPNVSAWWERCLEREAVRKFFGGLLSLEDIHRKLAAARNR